MIRRREFIAGLGGAAAWPLAARAQQGGRIRRIGVLMPGNENDPVQKNFVSAFIQALAGLGWTDGRNVRMDHRWGGGDINRIQALAQELVGSQPDIIVTNNPGDRCPPAGDADDSDRLCERGRSRRQRHRP
jgi:putative ABC transport system substrate-binding protein